MEGSETYSTTSSNQSLEILKGINLDVTSGQLVGLVGAVGCGKSSVFSAILNEVYFGKSHFKIVRKSFSYFRSFQLVKFTFFHFISYSYNGAEK